MTNNMDYKKTLIEKINNLVNGNWSVSKFEEEYYKYFLNEVPDMALTTNEMDFFGLVQERLDWTGPNPTMEEKKEGYLDYQEYTEWLKKNIDDFLRDGEGWHKNYIDSFK